MKYFLFMFMAIFGFVSAAVAQDDCAEKVKGKLANQTPITIDQSNWGRINLTIALAEARLRTKAGAVCVNVEEKAEVFLITAYFPIISGPETGKLIAFVNVFLRHPGFGH